MKKRLGTIVAITVVAILIGTFNTAKYATGGETGRDGQFIAYDDGTVLDTRTNLMWAAKDNGGDINWADAKSYCENYSGGGYTDWRMPTQDELAGLYDNSKTYQSTCGYDVHLTELIYLTCCCPWASETRSSYSAFFYFCNGYRLWFHRSNTRSYRALPVRLGKEVVWSSSNKQF